MMTDRLDELLKRQFAREEARKHPSRETTEELLARSRKIIEETNRTVARYNAFVANRPSNARLIIQGISNSLVQLWTLIGFLFIFFILSLIILGVLVGFGII